MKAFYRRILYVVILVALIALWEIASSHNTHTRLLISSPSLVIEYISNYLTPLAKATFITFLEAFTGLIIATIFSFLSISFCLYFPRLLSFILPIMVVSQIIPLITLAPLFILLFGLGITAKIMMAALLCFFPIFISFANSTNLISPNVHDLFKIYNGTKIQKIRFIYFPLCLPYILSGLKIASTLAVIAAVVAEFTGASVGLGKNIFLASKRLEPELMISSVLLSSFLGIILFSTIYIIELKLGKWYLKQS